MAQCGGSNNDKSNGVADCKNNKSNNNGGGSNNNNNGGGGNNKNTGGGGSGSDKKPEELQPHPVKEQLPGVQYCVNSPPPWSLYSPPPLFFSFSIISCFFNT